VHPILFHFGFLSIPTFGVLAAVGLMLSLALSLRTARVAGLAPDALWNAGLFAIVAAFVLSRVLLVATNLHSFFSYPILLLMVPSLTLLGLLLTALATAAYLRVHAMPFLPVMDAWAPCAALTWCFLALGHFFEGSDPGLPSRLPWAMPVVRGSLLLHPVALYAAFAAALITLTLLLHLPRRRHAGDTAALGLALCGLAQFVLSFVRQPAYEDGTLGSLLDPLEWVSLGMIILAALLWQQPRRVLADAV
jgi:phosphatidylglycerol---prolipoprotein diacylglyceryl transferase